jgi:hypothetical protein
MSEAARELLDEFNDGNWNEVGSYFNDDFETFLDYLEKNGLDTELDYENVEDEFKNIVLLRQLEKNPQETLKYICDKLITDVYPMDGEYYLYIRGRGELAKLFKEYGRDTSPRGVAEKVLDEDWWEPFGDTTYDVYEDVIEELNDENKQHLAQYILKLISDQELSLEDYDSELFQQFSEEQGTEGVFKITNENVMQLIDDRDAMNEMSKKDLDDLESDLYSVHNNAYNTAYTDEIYNDVWDALSEYFEPKSWKYEEKETYDGKKIQHEHIKIKGFESIITKFLQENKTPQYNDSYLDYFGDYCGLLNGMMDSGVLEWLDFSISDYADWTLTKEYINDLLRDYI